MNKEKNKKWSKEKKIGVGVGATAFGAGMVDLRPRIKAKKSPYLGASWKEVSKHVKPGDVLIGASQTATGSVASEFKGFKKNYAASRKTQGIIPSFKKAIKQVDVASMGSKFADPSASHAEVFGSKTHVGSGGEKVRHVTKETFARTPQQAAAEFKKGYKGHWVLLRPKEGVSKIQEIAKKKGTSASKKRLQQLTGGEKFTKGPRKGKYVYSRGMGIKNAIVDWITPKFRRKEKVKTKSMITSDARMISGGNRICSTPGALASTRTTGGKSAKSVLPKDYLRSADYKVIGRAGKGKTSLLSKTLFNVPKYGVKAGFAGVVGLGAYGIAKGVNKIKEKNNKFITKKAYLDMIYEESFINELEEVSNG